MKIQNIGMVDQAVVEETPKKCADLSRNDIARLPLVRTPPPFGREATVG